MIQPQNTEHSEQSAIASEVAAGKAAPNTLPRAINVDPSGTYDVAIIGAGVGGLAAGIFLRQQGLSVICIEPEPFPHARVGESLDWSSPSFLKTLGLDRDILIEDQVATYKKNIKVVPFCGLAWTAQPEQWFLKPPLKFEVTTLHVDRAQLDQRLFERAQTSGVNFVWDVVSKIDTEGERILACETSAGQRISGKWFLDNSGQARIVAEALGIEKMTYGQRKVCLWTYFASPIRNQGTTFYGDSEADDYLTWIWEIPITPHQLSIGCVMPAESLKERRRSGASVEDILWREMEKYPDLAALLAESKDPKVLRCSYQSYVSRRVTGPNWLMIGEAASFPDPLTANGVTAAFRHAQEACEMIKSSSGDSLSRGQRRAYEARVRDMGCAFNHSIETMIYDWPVRKGLSVLVAQKVYTAFSYPINALYTRLQPRSRFGTALFGFLLDGIWLGMKICWLAGRLAVHARGFLMRKPRKQSASPQQI